MAGGLVKFLDYIENNADEIKAERSKNGVEGKYSFSICFRRLSRWETANISESAKLAYGMTFRRGEERPTSKMRSTIPRAYRAE